MDELRNTDTNSANDSKGRAFGLEGNDFVYVLVAFVAAFGLYLVLQAMLRVGNGVSILLAAPVVLVPLAWALFLRRNKPEGYAEDWLDHAINAEGWSFAPSAQPAHPREVKHEPRRA